MAEGGIGSGRRQINERLPTCTRWWVQDDQENFESLQNMPGMKLACVVYYKVILHVSII